MEFIDDTRFIRQMARYVCGRPRLLDGGAIVVEQNGAAIDVRITNGVWSVLGLSWRDGTADVIPFSHSTAPGIVADYYSEEYLTVLVGRFLRRHGFINRAGIATRKTRATA